MVRRSLALAAAGFSVVLASGPAWAQSQLHPIVTSETSLSLPTVFGTQSRVVRNEAGDVAVLDTLGTAVHLKMNGAPAWTRVVQAGDEVPGLAGSRISAIASVLINASGLVAMGVELNLASGEPQSAVVIYNGASLVNVVDGTDTAPNSGGANFGRGLRLAALSNNGSVAVTSPLVVEPSSGTIPMAVFIVPGGGGPVRIAGPGDPAPGTATTFTSVGIAAFNFNANGELLIGGSFAAGGSGMFVGTTTTLRKVVAIGDPNPTGGTFNLVGNGCLNNLGRVVFTGFGGTSSGLFIAEPDSTVAQIFANGSAAPVPGGGTVNPAFAIAFNDAGTALFESQILGNPTAARGIFRITPGGPLQVVVHRNQQVSGSTIGDFVIRFSFNATGATVFSATRPDGSRLGYYYQTGTNQPVQLVQHGGPSGVPGGGTVDLATSALDTVFNDGRVLLHLAVVGGTSDAAYVVRTPAGATTMLLTTSDELPAGGRTLLSRRPAAVWGAGDFVAFMAMRPGGTLAAFVHHRPTQVTTRVAAHGDTVQGTSERLFIPGSGAVLLSTSGQLVVTGQLSGPSGVRPGVVIASAEGGLHKIVGEGDQDSEGRVITAPAPSGVNSSGQVLVSGTVFGIFPGIWIGSAGTPPAMYVIGGAQNPITGFASVKPYALNDVGQVLFAADLGLYLGGPTLAFQRVVLLGAPAPGGGTFSSIGHASLNNHGQFAFSAAVFDGVGFDDGGFFVGSANAAPIAIARNHDAAPGGGTFLATFFGFDVYINDQADVLFRSELAGSPADSGYFIRRGPASAVTALVREGDPAPGTPSSFMTFQASNVPGKLVQLNTGGGVTFLGDYLDGGAMLTGSWHVRPDGVIEPVAAGSQAAFDGGSSVRISESSSWSGAGYPIWARLTGSPFVEGVFFFVPFTPTTVPTGSNVQVTPTDSMSGQSPVTATFTTVTGAGVVTLNTSSTGPALPAGFALGVPPRFYDVGTTATFTGAVEVCVNFTGVTFPAGSTIRLLHYTTGAWSDVTTTVTGSVACGLVTSLSPFAVARLTTVEPNLIQNGDFSGGLTSWLTFATPDASYIQATVSTGVLEFYRVPPPSGTANQAVVFQNTGIAVAEGVPLIATFDLGNTTPWSKRISVLLQDADFSDLSVCTFWLPASQPLTKYEIRTHTTKAWTNATMAFYAASLDFSQGVYRVDNVSLRTSAEGSSDRTECVDPRRPAPSGAPDGPTLLVNGDFSADLPPWGVFGQIVHQVTNGVFEFHRPAGTPAGVVLQPTLQNASIGQIFTATFELGNTFPVRRRVTILLHENDFSDLAACTFWLSPGQPLQPYAIRMFASRPWLNATLSIYPASIDTAAWFQLDNVTLRRTPGATLSGTDCIEPPATSPPSASAAGRKASTGGR